MKIIDIILDSGSSNLPVSNHGIKVSVIDDGNPLPQVIPLADCITELARREVRKQLEEMLKEQK